ncbi:hypothetical protein QYF36_014342 [Acer negundo]|nr:hypothetical protein QYF36_014342 [Acer negundo]
MKFWKVSVLRLPRVVMVTRRRGAEAAAGSAMRGGECYDKGYGDGVLRRIEEGKKGSGIANQPWNGTQLLLE